MDIYRIKDRVIQWFRYSQPSRAEKKLLGLYTDSIDTEFTAARLASKESVGYILEHMRTVPNFETDYDLHNWIPSQVSNELAANGLFLEFGVATGRTLNHFARLFPKKTVYGFDGFRGLPEDWTSRMPKGFFDRKNVPMIRNNCELVVGWFDQTLPGFLKAHHPYPIALLHVDCDLYSSTATVLSALSKQIVPGTIIVFDEYINYPGWQLDEFKAWHEYVGAHGREYEYIGRVSKHQQVAVRVTK